MAGWLVQLLGPPRGIPWFSWAARTEWVTRMAKTAASSLFPCIMRGNLLLPHFRYIILNAMHPAGFVTLSCGLRSYE